MHTMNGNLRNNATVGVSSQLPRKGFESGGFDLGNGGK